jgi:hypothetical protein
MAYKINGVEFPIQPTSGRWTPKQIFGITGDGHAMYPGVREFEMRWGLLDATGTNQLQNFFNAVSVTGTVVVELPKYASPGWIFYAYSGVLIREPEFGPYFNTYTQEVTLTVSQIKT